MKETKLDTTKHILGLIEDTRKLKDINEITPLIEEFDKAIKDLTWGQLGVRLTIKK